MTVFLRPKSLGGAKEFLSDVMKSESRRDFSRITRRFNAGNA